MFKLVSNSVNKLTNLSSKSWITEKTYRNVTSCCGIHTMSGSNAKIKSGEGAANKVTNFDELVKTRRAQAQRSILVPVQSKKSFNEFQKYCSQYGTIVGAHHYKLAKGQWILFEYSSHGEAQKAIKNSALKDTTGTCVRSPFVSFRALRAAKKKSVANDSKVVNGNLMVADGGRTIDYTKINGIMLGAENVSDQMSILFETTKINDLDIRIRFLAARQIEESMSGIFPSAKARIFGSSVNGYGKLGCDLDLILQLHPLDSDLDPTKQPLSRAEVQQNLRKSGKMLRSLPGISNVRHILNATVPIIKYQHELFALEVDLSLSNMSGVYMSEILYAFAKIDDRVQILVCTIRRWAQTTGITRPGVPSSSLTNFALTCLVIFYLQQLRKPVLPAISSLLRQACPQDKLLCPFLRDINLVKFSKENTDSLDQLLMGFFEYYSRVNFFERAISLNDAQLLREPIHESAMNVINPLEPTLNVTKNVSVKECERFRTEVRNAAWLLESTGNGAKEGDTSGTWGLMNLFRDSEKPAIRPTIEKKKKVADSEDGKNDKKTNDK